jgi:hypothetical protein
MLYRKRIQQLNVDIEEDNNGCLRDKALRKETTL